MVTRIEDLAALKGGQSVIGEGLLYVEMLVARSALVFIDRQEELQTIHVYIYTTQRTGSTPQATVGNSEESIGDREEMLSNG